MIDKIFAVQNCGTSGTLLLQSLFDGHPQVLSLPALHGRLLPIFWEKNCHLSKNDLLNTFINEHPFFFQRTDTGDAYGLTDLGENRDEVAMVDKTAFTLNLKQEWDSLTTPLTRKSFLISVYTAYNKALGKAVDPNGYLLYPVHCLNQKYAQQLVEDFSEVKFLHLIREPIQNIGSLARHIHKNPSWKYLCHFTSSVAQILSDFTIHVGPFQAHGMIPYIPDSLANNIQSRAIKLEDIHLNSRATLSKVCDWLKVNWSDVLLQSTYDGKSWHNRAESIRQAGLGNKTISQTHADLISNFDRYRLNYIAEPFKKFYGYDMKDAHYSYRFGALFMPFLFLLPFKMEWKNKFKPRSYVKCRLLWLIPAKNRLKKMSNAFVKML